MATTLPQLTRTLDDDFVNTWYEIRPYVVDNVLTATIFWFALKEHGCLKSQVGGEYITRTVGYGTKGTQRFNKGSTLSQSTPKLDTMARWDWRYFLIDINRTLIDDAKNSGPFKIKSYLARRIGAARDGLVQDLETYLHQWGTYYEAPLQPNGLYDICPQYVAEIKVGDGTASDSQAVGTSQGNLNRTNTWWRNWVASDDVSESASTFIAEQTHEPYAMNLLPDMRHFYNCVTANQESPNFILMDQNIYEAYEEEASDRQQIVRNRFTRDAVDLGFVAQTFKGATMSYSAKLSGSKHVFMLNLNRIELVYDPNVWFDMTNWMETPNQLERVAYIVCMTPGLITEEPRRHGAMEYAS